MCIFLAIFKFFCMLFRKAKDIFNMQYLSGIAIATAAGLIGLAVHFSKPQPTVAETGTASKWYTWEEAVELNKTKPKKILVDVYTDWCGWCKRMDKGAFVDTDVTKYLNDNFYPVKLNAEQRENIVFGRDTFNFVDTGNGKGIHTLAYALLDGKMSYPTIVYLDEQYRRIMISPGYKESGDLLKELKFAKEEQYNKTSWEEYKNKGE
jgi:thioredoxin-related protein